MLQINEQFSESLKVKPLLEGQTATYKLCDADLVDLARVDDKTGKPRNNQPRRNMKGEVLITDPYTKKRVRLRNIVGEKAVERNGDIRMDPEVKRVQFDHNSVITLGSDDPGTYLFMERHPRNRDNPFRDKDKTPTFYRMNSKKKAIQDMEHNYILADALNHVVNSDKIELIAIWKNLDPTSKKRINPEGSYESIKRDTFDLAKEKPAVVMKASSNREAKAKLQIMDAEYYNVIMFTENEEDHLIPRRWMFVDGEEDICEVSLTDNKIDGLMKYMFSLGIDEQKMKAEERDQKRKIGISAYQKMAERLKKIFNPKNLPVPA